ncbi:hypothetical protein F4778DRAFT_784076 [Xylariomycetidae sp. FL2044]|nr:hypothetical protein F4778DRAFT_784076 [Xylariomycetidae sp. FL2044]
MTDTHGQKISHYNYLRTPANEMPPLFQEIDKLIQISSNISEWEHYHLEHFHQRRFGYLPFCSYSILPQGAYNTSFVNLEESRCPMRHRDIIVDNWKAAGLHLSRLAAFGYSGITRTDVRQAIDSAMLKATPPQRDSGETIFLYSEPGWADLESTIFIRGLQKMLQEYSAEFLGAKLNRAWVKVDGSGNSKTYFMAVFMPRPGR